MSSRKIWQPLCSLFVLSTTVLTLSAGAQDTGSTDTSKPANGATTKTESTERQPIRPLKRIRKNIRKKIQKKITTKKQSETTTTTK